MNSEQIVDLQKKVGTKPDGFWGPKSTTACQEYLKSLMPSPNPWPSTAETKLQAFYGDPGDEDQLVAMPAPVAMFYEGKKIRAIRCHRKVADSLSRALTAAHTLAPSVVRVYDGCFNYRPMRGGTKPSLHARGAAIDLDADRNGNSLHWPTGAVMPITVMEAFAREGWTAAGAFWSRDAMHFQATRP